MEEEEDEFSSGEEAVAEQVPVESQHAQETSGDEESETGYSTGTSSDSTIDHADTGASANTITTSSSTPLLDQLDSTPTTSSNGCNLRILTGSGDDTTSSSEAVDSGDSDSAVSPIRTRKAIAIVSQPPPVDQSRARGTFEANSASSDESVEAAELELFVDSNVPEHEISFVQENDDDDDDNDAGLFGPNLWNVSQLPSSGSSDDELRGHSDRSHLVEEENEEEEEKDKVGAQIKSDQHEDLERGPSAIQVGAALAPIDTMSTEASDKEKKDKPPVTTTLTPTTLSPTSAGSATVGTPRPTSHRLSFGKMLLLGLLFSMVVVMSSIGTAYYGTVLALKRQRMKLPATVSQAPVIPQTIAPTTTPTTVVTTNSMCDSDERLLEVFVQLDSRPTEFGLELRDSGGFGAPLWRMNPGSFVSFTQFQRPNRFTICLFQSRTFQLQIVDTSGTGLVSTIATVPIFGNWRVRYNNEDVFDYHGDCRHNTTHCGNYCDCDITLRAVNTTGRCRTDCGT